MVYAFIYAKKPFPLLFSTELSQKNSAYKFAFRHKYLVPIIIYTPSDAFYCHGCSRVGLVGIQRTSDSLHILSDKRRAQCFITSSFSVIALMAAIKSSNDFKKVYKTESTIRPNITIKVTLILLVKSKALATAKSFSAKTLFVALFELALELCDKLLL